MVIANSGQSTCKGDNGSFIEHMIHDVDSCIQQCLPSIGVLTSACSYTIVYYGSNYGVNAVHAGCSCSS